MNRRRLTVVAACAALGAAAITAWFSVPILQERHYLNLIADGNLSALDDDRKQEVFEKLADLCRCKNLAQMVEGANRLDDAESLDGEDTDIFDELLEETDELSWSEIGGNFAASVVLRCKKAFVRLLSSDAEESSRLSAISLAGVMGDDAAFVKPELLRILTNPKETKELRLEVAGALRRMSRADEWSETVAGVLRTEHEDEIRKSLIFDVYQFGSPIDSLLDTLRELSDVDALSKTVASALLRLEPNMLNTRLALSHLGNDDEFDIGVLSSLVQPAVEPFLKALEEQETKLPGLATFRKLEPAIMDAQSWRPVPPPVDVVIGEVDEEDELVSLSLGLDDNVARGYEFTVARGNHFIGKVIVVRVEATTAYARVLYTKEGESVRPGDQAFTATAIR